MEQFSCTTKLICGAGALEALSQWPSRRLFLVTDPYFSGDGTAQRVSRLSGAETVEIYDRVEPEPTVALAAEGTARLREFGADLVVALGGGSAMDLAKAMVYFSRTQAPLVAVPTTSGSGSEVTDFAVLTHQGVKHPLVDPRLRPAGAILDSDLLQSLPKPLIAATGFDVLTHALEACAARNGGAMTELLAREAFRLAYAYLPASYNGRQDVRLPVHRASALAGLAFSQSGLGLCHALSHALGGLFHIPHGRLNAILLPSVIACNAQAAGHRYAELARGAGISGSADSLAVRNLRNGLLRLRRELELPETLAQAGVPPREVWSATGRIVEATLADPCCKTNPVPADDYLIRRLLEEVTGRG